MTTKTQTNGGGGSVAASVTTTAGGIFATPVTIVTLPTTENYTYSVTLGMTVSNINGASNDAAAKCGISTVGYNVSGVIGTSAGTATTILGNTVIQAGPGAVITATPFWQITANAANRAAYAIEYSYIGTKTVVY